MRITGLDCYHYDLHYAHGEYVMSGGRAATSQVGTLVRLRTDEGLAGWGEVTPLGATYLPTFADGVRAALRLLAPELLGLDPTNVAAVRAVMDATLCGQQYAKSPVDVACWDLRGRAWGQPVAGLLGGVLNDDFPLYEAVPLRSPAEMAEYCREREAAGITRFQLKVGNDPLDDAARTRAVRQVVDPTSVVVADANGGWDLLAARRAVAALADLQVLVEQPCLTTADCALVMRHSALPLVLDESVVTAADVVEAREAGASSVNVKISRVGGLTAAARVRDLLQDLGLTVSLEDTWGGDVISAAVAHLAASTRPASLGNVSFFNDWTDGHVAGYAPRSVNGRGSAPTGPGLGIEVDVAALGEPLFSIG